MDLQGAVLTSSRPHFDANNQSGMCLQASFGALEQLSVLRELIQKCLLPSVNSGKWQLYTTPPKQVRSVSSFTIYILHQFCIRRQAIGDRQLPNRLGILYFRKY